MQLTVFQYRKISETLFLPEDASFSGPLLADKPPTASQRGREAAVASRAAATTSLAVAGCRLAATITSRESWPDGRRPPSYRIPRAFNARFPPVTGAPDRGGTAERHAAAPRCIQKAPPGHPGQAELQIYGIYPIEEDAIKRLRRPVRARSPRPTA